MKPDLYTKVMLTIIAASLVWLSLGGPARLPVVRAADTPHVILEGWMQVQPGVGAGESTVSLRRFTASTGVPVTVTNSR